MGCNNKLGIWKMLFKKCIDFLSVFGIDRYENVIEYCKGEVVVLKMLYEC